MLRENESGLFLSLCRASIEVAFPHCATCFGRCYPGGAALIMEAKNLYDGVGGLLTISSSRELPKPVNNAEEMKASENCGPPVVEDGITLEEESEATATNAEREEQKSPALQTHEKAQ
ncbi:hypothetical protein SLEP1_g12855 [Rubroshorea leprosula]|uniref:Conserved oligomeric Golgi complex subunit 8 n=1 Tax=Rubroshorea leprosula TaxID=152421 RepID=A0AAV5ILV2_9ROSI|nr:hypothetical protein SLEP1_g12855 [Rubroshorea leprosula]